MERGIFIRGISQRARTFWVGEEIVLATDCTDYTDLNIRERDCGFCWAGVVSVE